MFSAPFSESLLALKNALLSDWPRALVRVSSFVVDFGFVCLSVNTALSLRLASGPCRSVLVYRGLVESVWPRATSFVVFVESG